MRQWLWVRLSRYWPRVAVIVLALALDVVFATLFPLGVRVLIDNAVVPGNGQVLLTTLATLTALFAATTVVGVVGDRLTATVAARAINDTRDALYRHLQGLSPGFFERYAQGDLISRFTSDCAALEAAIGHALPTIFRYGLQAVASVALLFVLDWRLALVTLLALPLTLVGPKLLGPRATRANYVRKTDEARVTASLQEAISGQFVVRAFGLEREMRKRLGEQLGVLIRSASRALYLSAVLARSTNVGVTLVELLIVGAGAFLLYQGFLTTGSLVAFIGLVLNVDSAVSHFSQALPEWLHAPASVQRIEELLREQPQVDDAHGAATLARAAHHVSFEHVSFGYSSAAPILRDLTVEIQVGRYTAIVGPSGSGKSTLLMLLARFYDPDQGVVKIDGADLRTVSQASLRGQMGIVFQESYLFSASVRENIRMGYPEASDDDVTAAAKAAQVHDAILGLPAGYDTEVGERGGRLSGGQRQRVALARAMLRQPSILLLDEPTAALDPATEAALNATLEQLGRGRTVISVTHRLASVVNADNILVMHAGRLVQQGTHDQLQSHDGLYRQLWDQQAGFVLSDDGQHAEVTPARLQAIPLLEGLDGAVLAPLATRFVTERYAAGRVIVEEGEPGDRFCILARGTVEVSRLDAAGQPHEVAVLEQGDFFGEIALLSDVPRTATVRARTSSIVLVLARDEFLSLAAASPALRAAVEEVAARRRGELLAMTERQAGGPQVELPRAI